MIPFEPAQAVAIVGEAARLALEMRGGVEIEVKPDETLVTDADRAVESFLRERLAQLAPEWSFLGEEGGLTGEADAPCWVIDPIDGTTNFVRGVPLWCVSVGAVHRGQIIFGGVAVPPQDEILWAAPGQGAWRVKGGQSKRLQVHDAPDVMQEDLIACNTTVERVLNMTAVPCRLRNFGSLAYHLVALAKGSLCASIAHYHNIYDVAGGVGLCEEAGCVARYIDGQPWRADVSQPRDTTPLLVAPPQIMALLLDRLKMN